MNDTTSVHDIIRVSFDSKKYVIGLEINWFITLILAVLAMIVFLVIKFSKTGKNMVETKMEPVELEIDFGKGKVKYNIERNYENLEIAHRLYIELITRKAALPIDENNDIIKEVYDSWYTLFQITRDELKKIPGELMQKNKNTDVLAKLAVEILNDGLRHHLTEYQGKFRKWYGEALADTGNAGKSPQEIQRMYTDYDGLMKSMKKVNAVLVTYANQLNKLISA